MVVPAQTDAGHCLLTALCVCVCATVNRRMVVPAQTDAGHCLLSALFVCATVNSRMVVAAVCHSKQ